MSDPVPRQPVPDDPDADIVEVDPVNPDARIIERAGAILRNGGLVAFPTETVYGLGANAMDSAATGAVFAGKGRPQTDPLIVHAPDVASARALVTDWPSEAEVLATRFWPGPLTLILLKDPSVPDVITAGRQTVAVRVPAHPVTHAILEAAAVPIAAPSANRFGSVSPTTAQHVATELGGIYDLLVDAGPTSVGVESTILDISGDSPVLLRPGGITLEALESAVGAVEYIDKKAQSESSGATAPGQFLRHYAPSTPLVLVEAPEGSSVEAGNALIRLLSDQLGQRGLSVLSVDLPLPARAAARDLYAILRSADATHSDILLVRPLESTGMGLAVNDRLFRAAQGRVVSDAGLEALSWLEEICRSSL